MARQKTIPRAGVRRFPDKPMSPHGLHSWWYRCLARAGIVPEGAQSGERIHKARHTADQRVLDRTGNLKAVQKPRNRRATSGDGGNRTRATFPPWASLSRGHSRDLIPDDARRPAGSPRGKAKPDAGAVSDG